MKAFFWTWLWLPLIHWLIVSFLFIAFAVVVEIKKQKKTDPVISVPISAEMTELTLQVTRADGTIEPPKTYRSYRNPIKRILWAIKQLFSKSFNPH